MKKLYHIYNESFEITHAKFFEEGKQPENAVFIESLSFIKPMFNPTTKQVYEGATPEEVSSFKLQEAKENEKLAYIKRAQDGQIAYAEISAEFRLAKLNGLISEEAHSYIEKMLIPVRNEVLAGQWISAQKELEILGRDQVGFDLYDRLYQQITNYISINY